MQIQKNLLALILSTIIGVAVVIFIAVWLGGERGSGEKVFSVVVAKRPINEGATLSIDDLNIKEIQSISLPIGAEQKINSLVGRIAKVSISTQDLILEGMLAPNSSNVTLSELIKPGKRAVSVAINEVTGVAGTIKPGNFVDVLLSRGGKGDAISATSAILFRKVLVLAVGSAAVDKSKVTGAPSTVTLELTLEEAQKLELARTTSTISLALRGTVESNPDKIVTSPSVLIIRGMSSNLD